MVLAILLVLAYLIGSIPSAVWVSKWVYGIDIREHGSGNAGATNTFRTLGTKAGVFVMLMDMLKGYLAVKLALLSHLNPGYDQFANFQVFLGLASVIGHIFPIWAEFRGGKGIATLFGMILSIQPMVAASLVVVFLCMLYLTRYVSLSSITASIAFPVLIVFIFNSQDHIGYRLFAMATAILVVLTHHKNIGRLLNGNESKVAFFRKKKMHGQ